MNLAHEITLGSLRLGLGNPLFLIAGPCVIESEAHARKLAEKVAKIAADCGVPYIFKASYDKANRSSGKAFRGPGLAEGLRILGKIKSELKLPILTDIHEPSHAAARCRSLRRAANSRIPFAANRSASRRRQDRAHRQRQESAISFALGHGQRRRENRQHRQYTISSSRSAALHSATTISSWTCARFRSFRNLGYPVVFDVTHSVQLPGGQGHASGGQPEFIEPLARAGVAAGVDGIFLETHDNPAEALSDGANALPLSQLPALLERLKELSTVVRALERAMSLETARRVLRIEAQAIQDVFARLDATFESAVEILFTCKGRVVVTGMGKSGLVGRKISATLSSTGTPSFFLHPADALHGDLGMLARGDAMLAVSYGGETEEIIQLLGALKRLDVPLVTLTGKTHSTLAKASDVALDVSVREEACSLNLAPTASTTVAMAVGDALAISLLERRGFQPEDFAELHPAGRLGTKLLPCRE